jgi:hypothetical protein
MQQPELQKRVEKFLQEIGVPGFIVFGYMDSKTEPDIQKQQLHIVSSFKDMPTNVAVKGLSKLLSDFTEKAL